MRLRRIQVEKASSDRQLQLALSFGISLALEDIEPKGDGVIDFVSSTIAKNSINQYLSHHAHLVLESIGYDLEGYGFDPDRLGLESGMKNSPIDVQHASAFGSLVGSKFNDESRVHNEVRKALKDNSEGVIARDLKEKLHAAIREFAGSDDYRSKKKSGIDPGKFKDKIMSEINKLRPPALGLVDCGDSAFDEPPELPDYDAPMAFGRLPSVISIHLADEAVSYLQTISNEFGNPAMANGKPLAGIIVEVIEENEKLICKTSNKIANVVAKSVFKDLDRRAQKTVEAAVKDADLEI